MSAEIQGAPKGSLVHRFVTSGKPGLCEFCNTPVGKLEAHHIKYSPEVTIKLCHLCHHRVHFWPNRLSEKERYKLFRKINSEKLAVELSKAPDIKIEALAKLVAPSRKEAVRIAQALEAKRINEQIADSLEKFEVKNKELKLQRIKALLGSKKLLKSKDI